jgi:two-component system heavy metal sensor histidine kinase CusS
MPRLSLTATFTAAFAIVAAITFYLAGSHLDRRFISQMDDIYNSELALKMVHLKHFAVEQPSPAALKANADIFLGQLSGNINYVMEMRSADDPGLLHFGSLHLGIDGSPLLAESARQPRTGVVAWGTVRGMAETVQLRDGTPLVIFIGRDMRDRDQIVERYRRTIIATTAAGTLVATMLGYLFARRALIPLQRMAAQVAEVTASRLDLRLKAQDVPQELRALALSLNDMLSRLDDGFSRLSQVTADLAHDLRTPIANLRGQTEVALSRARDAEEYQALLVSNMEEFQRLTRMIENMLFLARADNAQVALHLETLDLAQQMEQIAAYFEDLAEEAGLDFLIRVNGDIVADKILFRRAVSNLVSNALRYTQAGQKIEITSEASEDGMSLVVSNPGVAIPAEYIGKLFERFYRADESRSNSADSTGLGLAIVHSIMELHGGRAWAENSGGDADNVIRFYLFFPFNPR